MEGGGGGVIHPVHPNGDDDSLLWRLSDWCLGGLDPSKMEDGGIACKYHVSSQRRATETVMGAAIGLACLAYGWRNRSSSPITRPPLRQQRRRPLRPLRQLLLVVLTFVFGLEICFKFVTRTLIFALYPCHIVTMIWIYLLASPAGRASELNVGLYRVALHFTHGTLCGILFPIADDLKLPFEAETYWLQHYLLVRRSRSRMRQHLRR